jgi:hypothetical protein
MSCIALLVLGPERNIISNSSLTQAGAPYAADTVSSETKSIVRSVEVIMPQLYDMTASAAN